MRDGGCRTGGWFEDEYHYNTANVGEYAPGAIRSADYPYTSGSTGATGTCLTQRHHVGRLNSDFVYASNSQDATIMQLIYTVPFWLLSFGCMEVVVTGASFRRRRPPA